MRKDLYDAAGTAVTTSTEYVYDGWRVVEEVPCWRLIKYPVPVIQNAEAHKIIQALDDSGFQNIRLNQQQVNNGGFRVGINRPDIEATSPEGIRFYIEIDRSSSNRGPKHMERILLNDPDGVVILLTID